MAILNYTTKVAAERSLAEIQKKLANAGAQAIMQEYHNGVITHIAFRMETEHGVISFRLPGNIEAVQKVLERTKGVEKRYKTPEHCACVAWRIIKDWIEAQLAIIETGMATLPQVFLPYAQTESGKTVYECFEAKGMLAIGYKEEK